MPTIAPGDKVLVTGANGFLAVHIVEILLKKGYAVRGVVRSLDRGKPLKDRFEGYGDKFELAVVEDITAVRRPLFSLCPFFRTLVSITETVWGVSRRFGRDRRHRPHCFSIPRPRG